MDISRDDELMMLYKQLGDLKNEIKIVADDGFKEFSKNVDDECDYSFMLNIKLNFLFDAVGSVKYAMRCIEEAMRIEIRQKSN